MFPEKSERKLSQKGAKAYYVITFLINIDTYNLNTGETKTIKG